MEWIKCSDRKPEEGQHCWTCDIEGEIEDGCFHIKCPDFSFDRNKSGFFEGFCFAKDTGYYDNWKNYTHWMPYFSPEPPKD